MYVYILHFTRPIGTKRHSCQHYIGFADCLASRIQSHRLGHGARLTQVIKERGITFKVVRVFYGDRRLERRLKSRKNTPKLCPICNQSISPLPYEELSKGEIQEALIAF